MGSELPIAVAERLPKTGIILVWRKPREGYGNCWQQVFYDADDFQVSAEEWFGDIRELCSYWLPMPPDPPAPT